MAQVRCRTTQFVVTVVAAKYYTLDLKVDHIGIDFAVKVTWEHPVPDMASLRIPVQNWLGGDLVDRSRGYSCDPASHIVDASPQNIVAVVELGVAVEDSMLDASRT